MVTQYSELKPWVQMGAPGCSDALIIEALRKKLRAFFIDSRIWQGEVSMTADGTDTLALNVAAFGGTPAPATDAWALETVYGALDEVSLTINGELRYYICLDGHTSSADDQPEDGADWATYWKRLHQVVNETPLAYRIMWVKQNGTMLNDSTYFLDLDGRTLMFKENHAPASGSAMVARVQLIPTYRATFYPAWALDIWGDALAQGALADLLAMPNKAWTNYDAARVALAEYRNGLSDAKAECQREGTNRIRTVTVQ
jgi:hypothetical protein